MLRVHEAALGEGERKVLSFDRRTTDEPRLVVCGGRCMVLYAASTSNALSKHTNVHKDIMINPGSTVREDVRGGVEGFQALGYAGARLD